MDSLPPWGWGYLLPCPPCRVSQVPRRFSGYMPPPNHPGRPDATLLLSPGAGGRLPHLLGGSPPPIGVTRPNRVCLRCGLHPVSVLKTLTGSLDTSGYPWCRAVTSW